LVVLAIAVLGLAAMGFGAGGEPEAGTTGSYRVDAIFDSASFLIAGQDVKIAGAKVGSVKDVSLTPELKARVSMEVDGAFAPFRTDASCTIQPQSLIGEKFIQCVPGTPARRPLPESGGTPTVPLDNTSAPVDLDLVLSTFRTPTPQRAALIISALGGGLAGRDEDLSATIRRAAPALKQTKKVLDIVRGQTQTVASLVDESDRVIGALARRKDDVTRFIQTSSRVTTTTADRKNDLRSTIRGLPALLRKTRPALAELERLAALGAPALQALEQAAPSVTPLVEQVSTFTRQVRPTLAPLERAARAGRATVGPARPLLRRLRRAATQLRPAAELASVLLESMREKGALEGLQGFAYWGAAATARFDKVSHILPAYLLPSDCTTSTDTTVAYCDGHFKSGTTTAKAGRRTTRTVPQQKAKAAPSGPADPSAPASTIPAAPASSPAQNAAEDVTKAVDDVLRDLLGGGAKQPAPSSPQAQGLLDFLLGA
jgi:virulence factor Mce-like protein